MLKSFSVATRQLKSQLMGRPAHESAARLIEATGIPYSVDDLLVVMDKKVEALFRTVQPLPGVVKLVHHLQKHNIPMAVRPSCSVRTCATRHRGI